MSESKRVLAGQFGTHQQHRYGLTFLEVKHCEKLRSLRCEGLAMNQPGNGKNTQVKRFMCAEG
jgi:hypothetical protein